MFHRLAFLMIMINLFFVMIICFGKFPSREVVILIKYCMVISKL